MSYKTSMSRLVRQISLFNSVIFTFHSSVPGVRSALLPQSLQPVRGDISDNGFERNCGGYTEQDEDHSKHEVSDV